MNKINLSLTGREWNDVRALSSSIVSVICFAWFVIVLDDLFPLAACVVMACKAIFELSMTNTDDYEY